MTPTPAAASPSRTGARRSPALSRAESWPRSSREVTIARAGDVVSQRDRDFRGRSGAATSASRPRSAGLDAGDGDIRTDCREPPPCRVEAMPALRHGAMIPERRTELSETCPVVRRVASRKAPAACDEARMPRAATFDREGLGNAGQPGLCRNRVPGAKPQDRLVVGRVVPSRRSFAAGELHQHDRPGPGALDDIGWPLAKPLAAVGSEDRLDPQQTPTVRL